jgi:UDP-N-acetylmuramoyl-L-alanyl-D-glutamate--2,6-diaminopimelate ligase
VRLDRLIRAVDVMETIGDPSTVDVRDIVLDSREAHPGALFCCVRGARADGHDFAEEAVGRGCIALLCERPLSLDAVQVVVGANLVRRTMAVMAAELHGHPDRDLELVAVTGTNGKTTVAHMLGAIFGAAGRECAVLGTLDGSMTTEESPRLQATLDAQRAEGKRTVAMEVSSHALAQHRVDAIRFAAAIFTNLSPEHLDFHSSLEEYFETKAGLFVPERARLGVVNRDDEWGARLLGRNRIPLVAYSVSDLTDVRVGVRDSGFTWRGTSVELPLGGGFNVVNALAAATAAGEMGVDADAVRSGLARMSPVPGRMEPIDVGQRFTVLVDYAHTPAGLHDVLLAARAGVPPSGRVVVVFGCGGERDRAKRPVMGRWAAELADVVVVTNDNPRGEEPHQIIHEILAGIGGRPAVAVELDRARAIALAVEEAREGDIVVVAGRGHETTQDLGDRKVSFDDRAVVRSALERRVGASS